jgi:hypothetical protein
MMLSSGNIIMQKKYIVRLGDAEREMLRELVSKKGVAEQKKTRARILLKADVGEPHGPGWKDSRIAEAFDCTPHTVENVRESLVINGLEITVHGKPKSRVRAKVLDGEQEAKVIALRLGPAPAGFSHWTLRLLADQAVALDIVDSISHETVRRVLKKQLHAASHRVRGDSTQSRRGVCRRHGGGA